MEIFEKVEAYWQTFCQKTAPAREVCGKGLSRSWKVVSTVWSYIYRLRGLLMTAPVIICAVVLACMNYTNLPETVGLNFLASGDFSYSMARLPAVLLPLGLTAVCVVLTVCSKKIVFPWLISVFSLVLPLVIYLINVYPA
jgi:hypothetical protein